jgi:hypothetical protein
MVYEGASAAPVYSASRLSMASGDRAASEAKQAAEAPDPKPVVPSEASTAEPAKSTIAPPAAEKHGLFHRIGRFFSKTFGSG